MPAQGLSQPAPGEEETRRARRVRAWPQRVGRWARRVDRIELALLVAFCALGSWVAVVDAVHAACGHLLWTGTAGVYLQDEMQYLAWIRDASRHVLVSDMFMVHGTAHDYLQPLVAISGGLVVLGMAPSLALELWQPLAVIAALAAVWWLIHRLVEGVGRRRAALALALFGGAVATHPDLWLPFWCWGYPFGLFALAGAIWALAICARERPSGRARLAAAALGGLAAWLHPWQGETLILILLGGLWLSRRAFWGPRPVVDLRCATWVLCATALPLGYYAALGLLDPAWRRGAAVGASAPSAWLLALDLAPLGIPALLGYRRRVATRLDLLVRCWPPAALTVLAVDLLGLGSTPTHALLGISVPLSVLAVVGCSELLGPADEPSRLAGLQLRAVGWLSHAVGLQPHGDGSPPVRGRRRSCDRARALAIVAIAAATLPVCASELAKSLPLISPRAANGNFISRGDAAALSYLARDPQRGAVLTDYGLGLLVPGITDRRTYLGDSYWTPDWDWRWRQVFRLLGGFMAPRQARAFVRSTGARFLLSGCRALRARAARRPALSPRALGSLRPLVVRARRFGCATLLVLRPGRPAFRSRAV